VGIDPFAYLKDVFTRLPSMTNLQIKEITPKAWANARPPVLSPGASISLDPCFPNFLRICGRQALLRFQLKCRRYT